MTQSCAQCKYFNSSGPEYPEYVYGECEFVLPECVEEYSKDSYLTSDQGTTCPTFEARESATVYKWAGNSCNVNRHEFNVGFDGGKYKFTVWSHEQDKLMVSSGFVFTGKEAAQRASEAAYESLTLSKDNV